MVGREGQHEDAVIGIFELPGTSAHSKAAGAAAAGGQQSHALPTAEKPAWPRWPQKLPPNW